MRYSLAMNLLLRSRDRAAPRIHPPTSAAPLARFGWLAGLVVLCAACVPTPTTVRPGSPLEAAEEPFQPEAARIVVRAADAPAPQALEQDPIFQLLLAEFAGKREQYDEAIRRYTALALSRRDPALAERAARVAMFGNRTDDALANARLWSELQPGNLDARQILAVLLVRKGEAEGAYEHLRYVLANDRSHDGGRFRSIASQLADEADRRTALAVMEKLLGLRPADTDARMAYALLAIRADDVARARAAMGVLLKRTDINANLALAYLVLLQRHDQVTDGLQFLEQALARKPDDFALRLLYARLLTDARRLDDARREFLALEARDPDNPDVLFALGVLDLQADEPGRAALRFQALAGHEERRDDAAFYLGQIEESRGNPEAALRHYSDVTLGPNRFMARLRHAALLGRLGRVEEALGMLAALEPEGKEDARQRSLVQAEVLSAAGRLEEAMQVFDSALVGVGYDEMLLYNRAMLAERMGRLDRLEADLRQILEREPDNVQALNALGFTLADRTDRYVEAHGLIERALKASPEDFYILDSMGWVLFKLGKPAEALPYLERAYRLRKDPEVAAHLGEVLWALGRKEEARAHWDEAQKRNPEHPKLTETRKRLES